MLGLVEVEIVPNSGKDAAHVVTTQQSPAQCGMSIGK
jgi:hypothetical protein